MIETLWFIMGIFTSWLVFPQMFYAVVNLNDTFEVIAGFVIIILTVFVWPIYLATCPIAFGIIYLMEGNTEVFKGYWSNKDVK